MRCWSVAERIQGWGVGDKSCVTSVTSIRQQTFRIVQTQVMRLASQNRPASEGTKVSLLPDSMIVLLLVACRSIS